MFNIVIQRVHEIVIKVITVIVDGYIVEMCHVFDTVYTFEWAGESWNCGIVDLCCRKIDLCLTFEILTVIPILVFIILMWMHNVGCGLFHAIVLIDD